jgi:RNA-directed DNA polymerase
VSKRLREEFAKLEVEVNEEKSRTVDLDRAKSFGLSGACPDTPRGGEAGR